MKLRSIPPANRGSNVRIDRRLTKVVAKTGEALPELVSLLGVVLQPIGEIVTKVIEVVEDENDTS